MRLGDTLNKVAGLFVELPPEPTPAARRPMPDLSSLSMPAMPASPAPAAAAPQAKTIEQLVRESPGPNLADIKVPQDVKPPTVSPDGKPDFTQIYTQAGVPGSAFTAEQVLDLIATLPKELPLDTKRQSVKVMLTAMAKTTGVTPEMIVTDASRKLAALSSFVDHFTKDAGDYVTKTEADIASLQAQIEAKKKAIDNAKAQQAHVGDLCHCEGDRMDEVLEFFSLDVAPSKYAPGAPAAGQ